MSWLGIGGGILVLLVPLESIILETIFLAEGFPSFCLPFFLALFQLIVRCIVLLLHRLPRFF